MCVYGPTNISNALIRLIIKLEIALSGIDPRATGPKSSTLSHKDNRNKNIIPPEESAPILVVVVYKFAQSKQGSFPQMVKPFYTVQIRCYHLQILKKHTIAI